MTAVTQWFTPDDKPVHVGRYDNQYFTAGEWHDSAFRWLWDGKQWCWPNREPCSEQYRRWRGLAEKPEAK